LQSGGFGNEYTNVEGASNGESGFAFDVSTFGQAPSATLVNVTANDNAGAHGGVYLAGAGASVDVKGLTAERNVGAGIDILGAAAVCLVEGFRPTDNQGGAWVVEAAAGSAQLKIANAYARKTVAAGILQGQLQSATCVVSVVDYTAEFVAGAGITALADIQAAGTFIFRGCRTKGVLGFGVVAAAGVASKVIQDGSANDFTSATTPYFFDASALVNFGTFLANGVTPVVVPGAFLADQTIAISFQTLGGVQGAQPTITAKAANSFSVTATAGDLSLYDWKAT
jgi:hypothetical protein